jgi:hypothetical protein
VNNGGLRFANPPYGLDQLELGGVGMDDAKESRLKLLQAWLDIKFKIAGFVLIANGAALATAVAFLKEKGPELEGIFTLNAAVWGLMFGGIAITIPWLFSDSYFADHLDGAVPAQTETKSLPAWAQRLKTKWTPIRLVNAAFALFILLSAASLLGSVSYLMGVMDARKDFYDTHPGARDLLEKGKKGPNN